MPARATVRYLRVLKGGNFVAGLAFLDFLPCMGWNLLWNVYGVVCQPGAKASIILYVLVSYRGGPAANNMRLIAIQMYNLGFLCEFTTVCEFPWTLRSTTVRAFDNVWSQSYLISLFCHGFNPGVRLILKLLLFLQELYFKFLNGFRMFRTHLLNFLLQRFYFSFLVML